MSIANGSHGEQVTHYKHTNKYSILKISGMKRKKQGKKDKVIEVK